MYSYIYAQMPKAWQDRVHLFLLPQVLLLFFAPKPFQLSFCLLLFRLARFLLALEPAVISLAIGLSLLHHDAASMYVPRAHRPKIDVLMYEYTCMQPMFCFQLASAESSHAAAFRLNLGFECNKICVMGHVNPLCFALFTPA
jgi:hypothetical protein